MGGKQDIQYYYVEASELQKYFAAIPHFRRLKSKLSQQITILVNAVINNKENPGQLAVLFKRLEDRYSPSNIKLFIEATKEYLNSGYFNYPGKFTTKSWLGGNVKYVRENKNNPTIKLFNDILDALLQEFTKKVNSNSQPVHQPPKNRVSKRRNQISIGPFVTLAFFYTLNLVKGHEYAVNHQADPFGVKSLPSKEAVFARLNELHHFSSNAPLDQIRFWGFGQDHTNFTHYQILKAFAPALGNPGDLILFEGVSAGVEIPCDRLCVLQNANTGFAIGSGKECIENLDLGMFKCFGGDAMQIVKDYFASLDNQTKMREKHKTQLAEIMKVSQTISEGNEVLKNLTKLMKDNTDSTGMLTNAKELYKLYGSINKTLPLSSEIIQPHLSKLRQSIKNYEGNPTLISSFFAKVYDLNHMIEFVKVCLEISHDINEFTHNFRTKLTHEQSQMQTTLKAFNDKIVIKVRNDEGLIKTLEMPMVKNHQGNVFLVFGGGHFFPDPEKPGRKPNPDESQRSLQDFLDKHAHWIGYPKK